MAPKNHFGHGRSLRSQKMTVQIAGEQFVGLGSGDGLLRVFLPFRICSAKGNQRSRELHLWVVAAQPDGRPDPGAAVEAIRWIVRLFSQPLLVGFCEICSIEQGESVRMRRGFGALRASNKFPEKLLGCNGIFARVQSGAAESFHMNERYLTGIENG